MLQQRWDEFSYSFHPVSPKATISLRHNTMIKTKKLTWTRAVKRSTHFEQVSPIASFLVEGPTPDRPLHLVFTCNLLRDTSLVFVFHDLDTLKGTAQLFWSVLLNLVLSEGSSW